MCASGGNSTGALDSSGTVPAAALAAAVAMIAVGIVIVVLYGAESAKAWAPHKTFVFDSQDAAVPLGDDDDADAAATLSAVAESHGGSDGNDGSDDDDADEFSAVDGLDAGLSDTLRTSLIQSQSRNPRGHSNA